MDLQPKYVNTCILALHKVMYSPTLYDVFIMNKHLEEANSVRLADHFSKPHIPTCRLSLISIIFTKSSSEFRLIDNLSFPINYSFIDKQYCSVKYMVHR